MTTMQKIKVLSNSLPVAFTCALAMSQATMTSALQDIEDEMARTQKNKVCRLQPGYACAMDLHNTWQPVLTLRLPLLQATSAHLGLLKVGQQASLQLACSVLTLWRPGLCTANSKAPA